MRGSQHNDLFELRDGHLRTKTNNSGGVQGGISNGEVIYFRVAFKPPATISLPQQTCTFSGESGVLQAKGRHDPCVVPRAVPIVEAMAALVLADAALHQLAREAAVVGLPVVSPEEKGAPSPHVSSAQSTSKEQGWFQEKLAIGALCFIVLSVILTSKLK